MDRKTLRKISYGMYVVGTVGNKKVGCICNTAVQITSDPQTIAISINHDNYTNQIIKETKKFSLSILPEDCPADVIGTFGYHSSVDTDKYQNIETKELENLPVLSLACGAIVCNVIDTMETNTHTVFLGQIIAMEVFNDKQPMTYQYYQEVLKGKSPKNAPTYVAQEEKKEETKKTVWRCSLCGYEIETEELPENFVCPICGASIEAFEKIDK